MGSQDVPQQAEAPLDLTGLTYMVVADNRFSRTSIKGALQPYGLNRFTEIMEVAKALELLRELEVALAIIDIEGDAGIEFTRLVRRGGAVRNDELPVVIASVNAEHGTVMAAVNAGANAYVVKPFSGETLYNRIRGILLRPVPFIRSEGYVGPDRRTHREPPPTGTERRHG